MNHGIYSCVRAVSNIPKKQFLSQESHIQRDIVLYTDTRKTPILASSILQMTAWSMPSIIQCRQQRSRPSRLSTFLIQDIIATFRKNGTNFHLLSPFSRRQGIAPSGTPTKTKWDCTTTWHLALHIYATIITSTQKRHDSMATSSASTNLPKARNSSYITSWDNMQTLPNVIQNPTKNSRLQTTTRRNVKKEKSQPTTTMLAYTMTLLWLNSWKNTKTRMLSSSITPTMVQTYSSQAPIISVMHTVSRKNPEKQAYRYPALSTYPLFIRITTKPLRHRHNVPQTANTAQPT